MLAWVWARIHDVCIVLKRISEKVQKDTFHMIEDDKITVKVDDTALYIYARAQIYMPFIFCLPLKHLV